MKRTISMSMGKGSVSHNEREFHAENTDPERTKYNVCYTRENIHTAYETLFGEALEAYNQKQTRQDRCIQNYYEKIRTSKQEKPFHEIIVQMGNLKDCSAVTEDGQLAAKILTQHMEGFVQRNPNLYVFSAHLHMDEATPHLHIDFIPFTTGSKRGVETRVSLKKALEAQGFKGCTKKANEWNQWIASEKEHMAEIMLEHGIEWEQKGTHFEHLTVTEYRMQERQKELDALTKMVDSKQKQYDEVSKKINETTAGLKDLKAIESKETMFDKNKVIISKTDFSNLKKLARQKLVMVDKTKKLKEQVSDLTAENKALERRVYEQSFMPANVELHKLKEKYSILEKLVDQLMKFIDRFGLREKWEEFIRPKQKEQTHRKTWTRDQDGR